MTKKLTQEEGQILLATARQVIENQLKGEENPPLKLEDFSPGLSGNGACFVTLTKKGVLRGCIGSIEASQPLIRDVQDRAVGAAFHDPRFPALMADELSDLLIEISSLTRPERVSYSSPEDLLGKLRPGIDGVILRQNFRRATFLPQVWEQLPDPEDFLGRLCLKMGLGPDAWRDQHLDVEVYQVEKFQESDQ